MRGTLQNRKVWWARSPSRERQGGQTARQPDPPAANAAALLGTREAGDQRMLSARGVGPQSKGATPRGNLFTICSHPFAVSKQAQAAKEEESRSLSKGVYRPEGGPWLSTMTTPPNREGLVRFRDAEGKKVFNRNQDPGGLGKGLVPVGDGKKVVYLPECALHCDPDFIFADRYLGKWRVSYIDEEGREMENVLIDGSGPQAMAVRTVEARLDSRVSDGNTPQHGSRATAQPPYTPPASTVAPHACGEPAIKTPHVDQDAYDCCSSSRPKTSYSVFQHIRAELFRDAMERQYEVQHILFFDPAHHAFALLTSGTAKQCTSFVFRVMVENLVYTKLTAENTQRAEQREIRELRLQRALQGEEVNPPLDEEEQAQLMQRLQELQARPTEDGAVPPMNMGQPLTQLPLAEATPHCSPIPIQSNPTTMEPPSYAASPDISPRPLTYTASPEISPRPFHSSTATAEGSTVEAPLLDDEIRASELLSENLVQDEATERLKITLEERKYALISQAQWVRYLEYVRQSESFAQEFQLELEKMQKLQRHQRCLIDEAREHLVSVQGDMVQRSTREGSPYWSASRTPSRAPSGPETNSEPRSPVPHSGMSQRHTANLSRSDSIDQPTHTVAPYPVSGNASIGGLEPPTHATEDIRYLERHQKRDSGVSRDSDRSELLGGKRETSILVNVEQSIRSRSLSVSVGQAASSTICKEDTSSRRSRREEQEFPAVMSDQDCEQYFALTSVSVTLKGIRGLVPNHEALEMAVVADIAECLDLPDVNVAVVPNLTDPSLDSSIHLVVEHDGLRDDVELQEEICYCTFNRALALVSECVSLSA